MPPSAAKAATLPDPLADDAPAISAQAANAANATNTTIGTNAVLEPAAPRIAGMLAVSVLILVTLARAFGAGAALFWLAGAAALLLIATGYRRINARLRGTSLILFCVGLAVLPFARAPLEALQRGVFVAALLVSLTGSVMLIARCAMQSHRIGQLGGGLRERDGPARYLSFTLTSQFFSGILGLAGANLMFVMAAPSTEPKSETRTATVVAVGRGFAAASCWSPVFGNMAILLALYPTLHWIEVFPVGLAVGQMTILIGALLDARARTDHAPAMPRTSTSTLLIDALPLLITLLGFLASIMLVSRALHIVISAAIVLLAPLVSFGFHAANGRARRRVADGLAGVAGAMSYFPALASEALLFMAAGCAGSILASAFPQSWIAAIGAALGGHAFFGLAFLIAAILATALAGIHPVLSAVFLASSLTPQALDLPPITHMAAILAGWGISTSVTPFSVLSLTASRYAEVGLAEISLGRNWRFALVNSLVACAVLTGAAALMR
ncbi:hypothetical protein [Noviherbaspirillum pedocola]|uniref:Uncharacterized protein n=1 Tax=Noviherbaspirillum pedocola TaxID=2801341 RepID=A0A934SV46_9BURK|nr:hypothetical protein [Noviherbaspirillum pedocola]MBK4736297.1 hypothetical protein [Noviherbaspirillum pedocola]